MKRKHNRLIPKGKHSTKRCVYCGKELFFDDKTKDHVPPRFIFKENSDDIKENRITVPCCFKCNQKYSIIEQRLKPLFEQLFYNMETDVKKIGDFNQKSDFNILMTKIALGYRYNESSKIFTDLIEPKISYFLSKDVDKNIIASFKKIRFDNCIEDISSNAMFSGLIITFDDIYLASTPTNILSAFWHEYDINHDCVRMSFYDKLFVQVQF